MYNVKVMSIVLFMLGIVILMSAYHNLDIAYNMPKEYFDYNGFVFQTSMDAHNRGMGSIILGIGFFLIGYIMILNTNEEKYYYAR